eukprot:TRINITY_DN2363_c0_g1_i3.p2 TRINITY_DN2363_c0_g1~~TRINITY_DN2363_c0_g1_i3.p2  ORF type:complete len:127 (-),score=28.09 TRINITY_DN2363_c0_g1_i3:167-547(-)
MAGKPNLWVLGAISVASAIGVFAYVYDKNKYSSRERQRLQQQQYQQQQYQQQQYQQQQYQQQPWQTPQWQPQSQSQQPPPNYQDPYANLYVRNDTGEEQFQDPWAQTKTTTQEAWLDDGDDKWRNK